MVTLSYDSRALRGDLIRASIGLVLTVTPIVIVPAHPAVFGLLLGAAILFGIFLVRTLIRQNSAVKVDDGSLTVTGPIPRRLDWRDLKDLKLRYFSTRRDRTSGWMQLSLKGAKGRITVESTLDRFDDLVDRATQAAYANRLALDGTTLDNLVAMGVDVPDEIADQGENAAPPDGRDTVEDGARLNGDEPVGGDKTRGGP